MLEQTVQLCDQKRRKSSLFAKMTLKKTNYDEWTPDEIHAELCYSESLLLRAILTFIEDDNLMGFVKGGMKIRTCLASYKFVQPNSINASYETNTNSMVLIVFPGSVQIF